MDRAQRRVLWITCASHGLIHVYELAVPALLILIQSDFGAGDFSMGRVVTLYGLLFGLGALPAGYLADRFGSKPLLLTCLWASSVSLLGMALSPSLGWFASCSALMGLSLSIYHPAGTALITHSMPATGRVFAFHGMFGNLGVAGSSAIAGLLGAVFGWRWALGLLATLGVGLGLRVLALALPSSEPIPRESARGQWPSFILLLVAVTFMGAVYRGMTTFLPKFFATHTARGTAYGGLLTTLALLVGLAGMYVAGRLVDRAVPPPRVFLAGALVQVPFLVALGWAGGPALLPVAMAVAFFHFWTQPPGNHMVASFTPPQVRGLGYGIYFFLSFGVGSLGAALGGWLSERFGLARTFPLLAALLVPAVLAMAALSLPAQRRARWRAAEPEALPPDLGAGRGP